MGPLPSGSDALENLVTGELSSGAEAFVDGNRANYRFFPGENLTPLLGDAILSTPGDTGRWREQGVDDVLARVMATELDEAVAVGAGLTVEILSITVPAVGRSYLAAYGTLSATWTNTGDLELQVFVSVDGVPATEINAGAVQSGVNNDRRGISVGASVGPLPVAASTVTFSLRVRNGLASGITVDPAAGNAATLRADLKRASVASVEPGILWYAPGTAGSDISVAMVAYMPSQLDTTVPSQPLVALLCQCVQDRPYRFRADPTSNKVWIMNAGIGSNPASYLCRYSRDEIGQTSVPVPEVAVEVNPVRTTPNFAIDFAFTETTGKCVVATLGTIRVYNVADLATSGVPVPTAVITVAGATTIQGLLVDGDDVWVSSYAGSFMFKLSSAQITGAGGVVVPVIILSGANLAGGMEYIEFDSQGRIWATFYDVNEVRRYDAIGVSGNPAPAVVIDISGAATGAFGITLDEDDNLFVSSFDSGALNKFTRDQTLTSGTKVPSLVLTTSQLVGSGGPLTFDRGSL